MLRMGRPMTPRSVERAFWCQVRAGLHPEDAAAAVGVSWRVRDRWFREGGGMPSLDLAPLAGRYLALAEREEIAVGLAAGESIRSIARRTGRSPSTISREIWRNCPRNNAGKYLARTRYRAHGAQSLADTQARRPKTRKLAGCPALHEHVQAQLTKRWSPKQISRRLLLEFPHDESMRISHEAIYQAIYVQGRGSLRR